MLSMALYGAALDKHCITVSPCYVTGADLSGSGERGWTGTRSRCLRVVWSAPVFRTFAYQAERYKLLLLSIMCTTRGQLYRLWHLTSQIQRVTSLYFLIRAGGVSPAESPLSPAYVAPEPWSSSLDPQEPRSVTWKR